MFPGQAFPQFGAQPFSGAPFSGFPQQQGAYAGGGHPVIQQDNNIINALAQRDGINVPQIKQQLLSSGLPPQLAKKQLNQILRQAAQRDPQLAAALQKKHADKMALRQQGQFGGVQQQAGCPICQNNQYSGPPPFMQNGFVG